MPMTMPSSRRNTALLIVDVQVAVVGHAHERDAIVANIARLLEAARRRQVPVVWVQHVDEDLVQGSDDWKIVPELGQMDNELVIEKSFGDAFEGTKLEAVLSGLDVGRVVVAGAQTDACIRSTIHGAFVRGYDVTLVGDAHTTDDKTLRGAPSPALVIAHTNMYWARQQAPGRSADVVRTEDLTFG